MKWSTLTQPFNQERKFNRNTLDISRPIPIQALKDLKFDIKIPQGIQIIITSSPNGNARETTRKFVTTKVDWNATADLGDPEQILEVVKILHDLKSDEALIDFAASRPRVPQAEQISRLRSRENMTYCVDTAGFWAIDSPSMKFLSECYSERSLDMPARFSRRLESKSPEGWRGTSQFFPPIESGFLRHKECHFVLNNVKKFMGAISMPTLVAMAIAATVGRPEACLPIVGYKPTPYEQRFSKTFVNCDHTRFLRVGVIESLANGDAITKTFLSGGYSFAPKDFVRDTLRMSRKLLLKVSPGLKGTVFKESMSAVLSVISAMQAVIEVQVCTPPIGTVQSKRLKTGLGLHIKPQYDPVDQKMIARREISFIEDIDVRAAKAVKRVEKIRRHLDSLESISIGDTKILRKFPKSWHEILSHIPLAHD